MRIRSNPMKSKIKKRIQIKKDDKIQCENDKSNDNNKKKATQIFTKIK